MDIEKGFETMIDYSDTNREVIIYLLSAVESRYFRFTLWTNEYEFHTCPPGKLNMSVIHETSFTLKIYRRTTELMIDLNGDNQIHLYASSHGDCYDFWGAQKINQFRYHPGSKNVATKYRIPGSDDSEDSEGDSDKDSNDSDKDSNDSDKDSNDSDNDSNDSDSDSNDSDNDSSDSDSDSNDSDSDSNDSDNDSNDSDSDSSDSDNDSNASDSDSNDSDNDSNASDNDRNDSDNDNNDGDNNSNDSDNDSNDKSKDDTDKLDPGICLYGICMKYQEVTILGILYRLEG